MKNVLVITPFSEFGKLICDSLAKQDTLHVDLRSTVSTVAKRANSDLPLDYALVDLDLGIERVQECVFLLRDKHPLVTLIVISKDSLSKEVQELHPWKILYKPFIESDLIEVFAADNAYQGTIIDSKFIETEDYGLPAWALDREALQKTLEDTLTDLDVVQATIYTKDSVLAQGGTYQVIAANECSLILEDYLSGFEHGEVIKQVEVKSTKYMLHASIIAIGIILAVLYNGNTPYQIARRQSRYLTTRITLHHLEGSTYGSLPERVETRNIEDIENALKDTEGEITLPPGYRGSKRTIHPRTNPYFFQKKTTTFTEEDRRSTALRHTRKWIYGRPERFDRSPDPLEFAHPKGEAGRHEYRFPLRNNEDPSLRVNFQGELVRQYGFEIPAPGQLRPVSGDVTETQPVRKSTRIPRNTGPNEEKTEGVNPPPGSDHYASHVSAPVAARRSRDLYYACLLIPRFLSTPITPEVRTILSEEMTNIFLSNGWKLESLVIDKDFMQWVCLLPATISPAKHVKIVREATTTLVTPFFRKLTHNGLLRDFWAPGQLLESGNELIARYEIDEFIESNRRQYYPGASDDSSETIQ